MDMRERKDKGKNGTIERYGSKTFAAILLIILLSIADAYLTLALINHGAIELNPIMAFYLKWGPVAFFGIKYFLTCAAVFLFLSVMNDSLFGTRIQGKMMIVFSLVAFALVVQWELVLMFIYHN